MLAILIALIMACSVVPTALAEEPVAGIVTDASPLLVVVDAGGNAPAFIDGAWNLTGGTYTVSGTARQRAEGLKITGDVTLDLEDATIDHSAPNPTKDTTVDDVARYAPAISVESGTVQMNLAGTNTVAGAPGYAGVFVAEGATLTIAGSGSLTAAGGNACPDNWHYSGGSLYGVPLPGSFGVGENQRGFFAGGAGIGGNGIWVKLSQPNNPNLCEEIPGSSSNFGTVRIDDGAVSATGGDTSEQIQFGAAAGIGAGGGTGITLKYPTSSGSGWSLNSPFSGTVEINGGTVVATGGKSINYFKAGGGAGIGTGGLAGNYYYCYNDVEVSVNGGRVTAVGNSDGAGIGGGENVGSGIIEITDGFVTAKGGDCRSDSPSNGGAGIGGGDGDFNYVWFISISGGVVDAAGAGDAAGIGAGNDGFPYGDIYFGGSADVTARGGSGRDGGNGIDADKIHLQDEANVRAYASRNGKGISYMSSFDMTGATSLWAQTGNEDEPAISSLRGIAYSSPSTYLVTNWDYRANSANSDTAYGWLDLPSSKLEGDEQFGFAWDDGGLRIDGNPVPFAAGATLTGGSWATLYSEPLPVAAYKTEHYQEQLDGAYSLAETDFPLYGEVGTTVEAEVKTYEHYHLNGEASTLSGEVVLPIVEDGEEKMLVLKAYYDLDTVTLSYDLNQGVGADGASYEPESVRYGASLVVGPAPTRDGYAFLDWSDGEHAHRPGEVLVLTADTMLTAQWEENPPAPPDDDPPIPPDDDIPDPPDDNPPAPPDDDPSTEPGGGDPVIPPDGGPVAPPDGGSSVEPQGDASRATPTQKAKGSGGLTRSGDAGPVRLLGAALALGAVALALACVVRRRRVDG